MKQIDDLLIGRRELKKTIKIMTIVIIALLALLIAASVIGYTQHIKSNNYIVELEQSHAKQIAHTDTARMILTEELLMFRSLVEHNRDVMDQMEVDLTKSNSKRDEKIRYIYNRDLDIVVARDSIWAKITREQPWDK